MGARFAVAVLVALAAASCSSRRAPLDGGAARDAGVATDAPPLDLGPCGSVGATCCAGNHCLDLHTTCGHDGLCAHCGTSGDRCCFEPLTDECDVGLCSLSTDPPSCP